MDQRGMGPENGYKNQTEVEFGECFVVIFIQIGSDLPRQVCSWAAICTCWKLNVELLYSASILSCLVTSVAPFRWWLNVWLDFSGYVRTTEMSRNYSTARSLLWFEACKKKLKFFLHRGILARVLTNSEQCVSFYRSRSVGRVIFRLVNFILAAEFLRICFVFCGDFLAAIRWTVHGRMSLMHHTGHAFVTCAPVCWSSCRFVNFTSVAIAMRHGISCFVNGKE